MVDLARPSATLSPAGSDDVAVRRSGRGDETGLVEAGESPFEQPCRRELGEAQADLAPPALGRTRRPGGEPRRRAPPAGS